MEALIWLPVLHPTMALSFASHRNASCPFPGEYLCIRNHWRQWSGDPIALQKELGDTNVGYIWLSHGLNSWPWGLSRPNTTLYCEIAFPPQTLIKTLIRHEVLHAKKGTSPLEKQPSQKSQAWQETCFPRAWSYVGQTTWCYSATVSQRNTARAMTRPTKTKNIPEFSPRSTYCSI